MTELERLRGENAVLREALLTIRSHYGQVCANYELCEHPACQSSYGSWATADIALRAAPLAERAAEVLKSAGKWSQSWMLRPTSLGSDKEDKTLYDAIDAYQKEANDENLLELQ